MHRDPVFQSTDRPDPAPVPVSASVLAPCGLTHSDLFPCSSYGGPLLPEGVLLEEELLYPVKGGRGAEGWRPWLGQLVERVPELPSSEW